MTIFSYLFKIFSHYKKPIHTRGRFYKTRIVTIRSVANYISLDDLPFLEKQQPHFVALLLINNNKFRTHHCVLSIMRMCDFYSDSIYGFQPNMHPLYTSSIYLLMGYEYIQNANSQPLYVFS